MLLALCVIAAVAGVAVLGAYVAADSSSGRTSDRWLISGPPHHH
jgi:hypothetical protein